ncbi:MAG: hypothetical protein HZB43_09255 [candidate division Zixibacteria bacterium]|nr:hypothetical protein [candidate division Zixibacteria bacterium]
MKIYVGNLEPNVSGSDLHATFGAYGDVASAKISTDNWSGVSRGFGFVEMAVQSQGEAAITALNKKKPGWQVMPVHEGQQSLRLHRKATAKQALSGATPSGDAPRRSAFAKAEPAKKQAAPAPVPMQALSRKKTGATH